MNREALLDKIRALLNKTVANGCSEPEALAALDKARAMMDAYEVTEADLKLTKMTAAVFNREEPGTRDPHGIKSQLAMSVATFTDCEAWRSNGAIVFCGLPSDAELARYLLDMLAGYVLAELANHLHRNLAPRGERRFIINGFVMGACVRIADRLRVLAAQSKQAAASNSRALVVVKADAVAEAMAAAGLKFRTARRRSRNINRDSYAAGQASGDRASFGRPIAGASTSGLLR